MSLESNLSLTLNGPFPTIYAFHIHMPLCWMLPKSKQKLYLERKFAKNFFVNIFELKGNRFYIKLLKRVLKLYMQSKAVIWKANTKNVSEGKILLNWCNNRNFNSMMIIPNPKRSQLVVLLCFCFRETHRNIMLAEIYSYFLHAQKDVMPSWLAEGRLKIFFYSSVKFNITLYNSIILLPINLWQITSHTCQDIHFEDKIEVDFREYNWV